MLNQSEKSISGAVSDNLARVPLCSVSISHSLRLLDDYLRPQRKETDTVHIRGVGCTDISWWAIQREMCGRTTLSTMLGAGGETELDRLGNGTFKPSHALMFSRFKSKLEDSALS